MKETLTLSVLVIALFYTKILVASQCDPNSYRVVYRAGVPFQEILAAIEEEKADILVMGTKSQTDLEEVLFKTTFCV